MPMKSHQPEVLEALKQAPCGMLNADIQYGLTLPSTTVTNALARLRAKGLAKWVLDPGFKAGFRLRWYATEHAPRAASDKNPADLRTQQRAQLKLHALVAKRIRNTVADPNAPADYSKARRIVAETPKDRFALPAGTRIEGGFSSLGIGRYLEA